MCAIVENFSFKSSIEYGREEVLLTRGSAAIHVFVRGLSGPVVIIACGWSRVIQT